MTQQLITERSRSLTCEKGSRFFPEKKLSFYLYKTKMNAFVVFALIVGSATADFSDMAAPSSGTVNNVMNKPQARESSHHSPIISSNTVWESAPYFSSPPATAFSAPPSSGFGIGGNVELGFPGIVNTALTIVLSLVGLSMLVQFITKVFEIPFFKNLIGREGRNLDVETITTMAHQTLDVINKLQERFGSD